MPVTPLPKITSSKVTVSLFGKCINNDLYLMNNDLYLISRNTLWYGLGSIRYLGAKLWNELPKEIRTSSSRFIFKKITKIFTRNHVKLFTSKHLKNTMLTSVKLMQVQFRKTGKGGPLLVS